MKSMNGKLLTKNISEKFLNPTLARVLEIILLLGIGMIAILLHARLRSPLNLPGHHGMEFMALLVVTRLGSKMKFACSISSLGIGFLLLFNVFGFKDPFMSFTYMIPGILLDVLFIAFSPWRNKIYIMALIAGIAYMTIPLMRLMIFLTTGFPYPSFIKQAQIIPLGGFFIFGLIGGLAGYLIYKGLHHKTAKSQE